MKFIKAAWKGIVLFALLVAINGFLWLSAEPIFPQPIESTVVQAMGATILLGFTLVFFLSTKNRLVNWAFGGLENVYFVHRWLALVALLLIFLHAQTANQIIQYYRGDIPFDAASMGPLARNIFIGLIAVALLAKYMKYEHWRLVHRLMVIPYVIAFYHAIFISSYDLIAFSLLGIWTMMMGVVGVGSSVYMILLYRKTAFKFMGVVVSKKVLADNVTELEVKMNKRYVFKTGQFTFLKIDKKPFNGVPHPFSISGGSDDTLLFTIKALGDYTSDLKTKLAVGDTMRFTAPFGHMTFDDYPLTQVWIAGGIGITPFLSHLRSGRPIKQKTTLYYSVKNKREAVHLDYLNKLQSEFSHFNVVFSESDTDGFLNVEALDLKGSPAVFMCGPVVMAKALKKQFRKTNKHSALIYEAFSFSGTVVEDGIALTKSLIKKIKLKLLR